MELPEYLHRLQGAELALAASHNSVALAHSGDPASMCLFLALASQCREHAQAIAPLLERYDGHADGMAGAVDGPYPEGYPNVSEVGGDADLFHGLQDLYLSACLVDVTWAVLMQVGRGLEDRDLIHVVEHCNGESGKQLAWIKTHIKRTTPRTLLPAAAAAGADPGP